MKRILALVLTLSMLLSLAACGCTPISQQTVGGGETAITVSSAEEASTKLAEIGEDLGYENALSELVEKSTTTVDGDNYYRLQQTYQGIPVYGRTAVCVTDDNGEVIAITGNVQDVEETVENVPTVTVQAMCESIEQYAMQTLNLPSDNCMVDILMRELVWYPIASDDTKLAYCLSVNLGDELYEIVVDAHTGEIFVASCRVMTESVSINMNVNGYEHKVNLWKEADGKYITYDAENNIRVLSANGETLVQVLVFETNTGGKYFYNKFTQSWYDEQGNMCDEPTDPHISVSFGFSTEENRFGVTQPTFTSLEALDQDACRMLFFVTVANDFFSKTLLREGWGNGNTETLKVVYDCANGSYQSSVACGVSMLSIKSGDGLNTVTHEMAHAMESSESRMTYSGESGAIMEALSDIFAEIVEYDFLGECDWLFDSGLRNLIDPSLSTESNMAHPSRYKGKNWYKGSEDNGGVHINSTVISHAAYLMSQDGGGLLSMDELAKLWYRAMLMMPSDCNFEECRQLVELAAQSMRLSDKQIECVHEAFDAVGIHDAAVVNYEVNDAATLSVYGADSELFGNYTVEIAETRNVFKDGLFKILFSKKHQETRRITTAGAVPFGLAPGTYNITVINNHNNGTSISFKIRVSGENELSNVDIYTDFVKDSLEDMPIIAHDSYKGNQGDSTVFNLNGKGLSRNDDGVNFRGNGNIGIDGTAYHNGFEVWIARWNFRKEISWASATFDLDGKYKTLTGKTNLITCYNAGNFDTTVYFYDGETLLASYQLTNADYITDICVDITGVEQLTLYVKDNVAVKGGTSFALHDMFLH